MIDPYFYIPIQEFKDGVLSRAEGKDAEEKKGFYVARLSVGSESTERVLVFESGKLEGLVRSVIIVYTMFFLAISSLFSRWNLG